MGYLGRGIHDKKFLKSLEKGKLRSMLDVINNVLLDVQIRNNYLAYLLPRKYSKNK